MSKFNIPEHMSISWQWGGFWYSMTWADSDKLAHLYTGKHPHGPTHAEKLELIARHGWDACAVDSKRINIRSPRR